MSNRCSDDNSCLTMLFLFHYFAFIWYWKLVLKLMYKMAGGCAVELSTKVARFPIAG